MAKADKLDYSGLQTKDYNTLLDELQDVTAKRFENEKPLRSVIKRMTVIDESIQL